MGHNEDYLTQLSHPKDYLRRPKEVQNFQGIIYEINIIVPGWMEDCVTVVNKSLLACCLACSFCCRRAFSTSNSTMTYSSTKEPIISPRFVASKLMFCGIPSNLSSPAYVIKALHKYALVRESIRELALSKLFLTLVDTFVRPKRCRMLYSVPTSRADFVSYSCSQMY